MDAIHTSIEIDASPETVWDVLTDFESYPEWNPRTRITGEPAVGAGLEVAPGPEAGRAPTFRPRVLRADPSEELRWLGHLWVRGLFDGEHRFEIEATDDGGSRLTQSEEFSGVLAGLVLRFIGADTEAGFHDVNDALKRRAESVANADADVTMGDADASTEPTV